MHIISSNRNQHKRPHTIYAVHIIYIHCHYKKYMLIFVVNRAHKELAIAEIESLTRVKGTETDGVYRLDAKWNKKLNSLAFTKQIWLDNKMGWGINKKKKNQGRSAHIL